MLKRCKNTHFKSLFSNYHHLQSVLSSFHSDPPKSNLFFLASSLVIRNNSLPTTTKSNFSTTTTLSMVQSSSSPSLNSEKNFFTETGTPTLSVQEKEANLKKMSSPQGTTTITTGTPLQQILHPTPSDIEISQHCKPEFIGKIAENYGIHVDEELEYYGKYKAKVDAKKVLARLQDAPMGNYILITGINPTPLGEGKSTTCLGISQALGAHLGKKVVSCLRQPSQGPVFGIKGGAAGGGYSQIVPMEEFNLHMTGDIHAITAANNLLAAAVDTRVFHESYQKTDQLFDHLCPAGKDGKRKFAPSMIQRLEKFGIAEREDPDKLTPEEREKLVRLNIDPATIKINRVMDISDRYLRKITVGQGPNEKGRTRETQFDIAVASECMAILALSKDMKDMRKRLGKIVVAYDKDGNVVTAEDIGVAGAMAVLMKDTIKPTLMQTIEGTPVMVHAGPFANIAAGQNSIIADEVALKLVGEEGFVLTEAGFGADIGAEKFFDIKCRVSGLNPSCAVIVASIRALKFHGGCELKDVTKPNVHAVETGFANLRRHIGNMKKYGVPVVVCINEFSSDTQEEIETVVRLAKEAGADDCVPSRHFSEGGKGAVGISEAIVRVCKDKSKMNFKPLYDINISIKEKIETIAKEIYGAANVEYMEHVEKEIEKLETLPEKYTICFAKTQYSFSHDEKLKGAPSGFTLPIKNIRLYSGAGLLVPFCGEISAMPGLPTRPAYYDIDIDVETGEVKGLF
nr:unnamed protein product [Naegleria fowleri]